jgi:hypothetical protein
MGIFHVYVGTIQVSHLIFMGIDLFDGQGM